MSRKWSAILTVIIVALGAFGLQMALVLRQADVKQYTAQQGNMHTKVLHEQGFDTDELEQVAPKDKDLLIDGKLYDVKSIKHSGNSVLVYANYKGDNDALIINFSRGHNNANGENEKHTKAPVKMVIHEYTHNPQTMQVTVPENTVFNLRYPANEVVTVDINVPSPSVDTSKHLLSYNGSV